MQKQLRGLKISCSCTQTSTLTEILSVRTRVAMTYFSQSTRLDQFCKGLDNPDESDAAIVTAIRWAAVRFNIRNIRECFESYCYTDERCAVCEEFYVDLEDPGSTKIVLGDYSGVSFCCKRCLLNGWFDVVNYLRRKNINLCNHPLCRNLVSEQYSYHTNTEKTFIARYVKNELRGSYEECADPECRRLGYNQSDAINLDESDVSTLLLEDLTRPVMYCSRKHALASKITTDSPTVVYSKPSEVDVAADCLSPHSGMWDELHNTYLYNPIYYAEKWFHTLFHVVAYIRYAHDADFAESIRKTISTASVMELMRNNPLSTVDYPEEEFIKGMETTYQELLKAKFVSNPRMWNVGIHNSKAVIRYAGCFTGVKNEKLYNNMCAEGLMTFLMSMKYPARIT